MNRILADVYSVFVGTAFEAVDQMGAHRIYRAVAFDPHRAGKEFTLMDLETESSMEVSESWFHQRSITIL